MHERILSRKIDVLEQKMVTSAERIDGWKYRLAEYNNPGDINYVTDWLDFKPGTQFKPLATIEFKINYTIPKDRNYFNFKIANGEALLYIDDRPYAGIDNNHGLIPIKEEIKGKSVTLSVEMMSLLGAMRDPERYSEDFSTISFQTVTINEVVRAFYYDVQVLRESAQVESNGRRKKLKEKLLEDVLLAVDLTNGNDVFMNELQQAAQLLKDRLPEIGHDNESGKIHLVGNSHIDVSWLWPYSESIRKSGRTFSTVIRLLEKYPDYVFIGSQPHLYIFVKEHYPALYDEIKQWAATGRWEVCGAMWVESDCNVPSGESLLRQMIYGNQFFQKEFGVKTRTCWLPDVFGYPGTLPTILKHAEIDFFLTSKLHWQAKEKFPVHLFKWKGIDGTEVIAHIPLLHNFYGGYPKPDQLAEGWENFAQKDVYDEVMFPFGHGDGGGGVTMGMLEYAKRVKNYPGLPQTTIGRAEAYFEKVEKQIDKLPVWDDELYLQTHRGTYTTQADVKKTNRKLEILLRNYELLSIVAKPFGVALSAQQFEELWRVLLLHQFHDDLPGSSIHQVYQDTLGEMKDAAHKAQQGIDSLLAKLTDNLSALANSVIVFNPLSFSHRGLIELDDAALKSVRSIRDETGQPVVIQTTHTGSLLIYSSPVAPLSATAYETSDKPHGDKMQTSLAHDGLTFKNRYFTLTLNPDGTIKSLVDRKLEREIIPDGEAANVMELFQDGPDTEAAWNIHDTFELRQYPLNDDATIEVLETGPVRMLIRVKRSFRKSSMEQDIMLYDHLNRIDFKTRFNWQERQVLLKVAFPVDLLSKKATYEIQFGAIERSTHKNQYLDQAKFEVCGHRWIDLSEDDYGVSLLNDSKYGYDVKGHKMRITLLRGSDMPDPTADLGAHEITYAIYPHHGRWTDGSTVSRALELNNPLLARVKKSAGGSTRCLESLLSVSKDSVIVDTVKPAEDGGGIIIRLYEAHGSRGMVEVNAGFKIKTVEACTALENQVPAEIEISDRAFKFHIKPFELCSFRVTGI
ncbi:alpha-mannosidase [candidate division KSB1 bacterium]|nr:alpha-mannosidase [candidate division KSB1 bacterium]